MKPYGARPGHSTRPVLHGLKALSKRRRRKQQAERRALDRARKSRERREAKMEVKL